MLCKQLFFTFSLYNLLLIVFCLALSLLSQDLEVFDKVCFPPVPVTFLGRPSCPLCLRVQDSWHLQHETWISCLPERQVCSALLHRAFTGCLEISPELARKLSLQSVLLVRLSCSKFHQRLLLGFTFLCFRIHLERKHELLDLALSMQSLSFLLWMGMSVNCNLSEVVYPSLLAVSADKRGAENCLHSRSA